MSLPDDEMQGGLKWDGLTANEFGRFRVLRTLAFGGMAQILLAEEPRAGRLVVLKRILPHYAANEEFVQYFIHEGRLGQRLRHRNLVETLEAGRVGDVCYIALEYLRGQPCIELLRRAAKKRIQLPLGVAVRVIADAARGLHHAHVATDPRDQPLGVVHRDVTPHNLFLCADGVTKVLDFGIAKAASQLHHTRTGTIKGKFAYLAPEQIRGEPIDHRVDVFALGIVLHELLTQKPLFRGANDAETLNRVLTMEVPAPETMRRGVPPGLGAVALRALMRDRDRRLPSAEALADSIEAVADAECIEASERVVAEILAELCPPDESILRDETPSRGSARVDLPTGESPTATPPLYGEDDDERQTEAIQAMAPIELIHPKAVPALRLADAAPDRRRRWPWRAAVVVAVALLALAASRLGSLIGRQLRSLAPAAIRSSPPPGARPDARPFLAPPARETPESTLRIVVEGPATFVVDGRAQRLGPDGALHVSPGPHRVTVSSPLLAAPRTLEVDLRAREAATRTLARGRGQLRVEVSPSAEVSIDGRTLGVTPFGPVDLGEGQHQITLKNGDLGVVATRRVVVQPNKATLLQIDLLLEKR